MQLQHSKVGIGSSDRVSSNSTLISWGGGADNNKTFLQSLEGFKVHVSELGHSPCLSVFGKKHPFGSETFAVATLNLHGVSLPDVYQNTDFC